MGIESGGAEGGCKQRAASYKLRRAASFKLQAAFDKKVKV
jgi:hypothetical protein